MSNVPGLSTSRTGRVARPAEPLKFVVSKLAKYLDDNWGNWRQGAPDADYILWTPPASTTVYIVGLPVEGTPGVLDIDGNLYYSDVWL